MTTQPRSMRRNASALLVARLISAGTTLVLLAIIGRARGTTALGVVGVGMAAGSLLAAVTECGASLLVVRVIAEDIAPAGRIVGGFVVMRLATLWPGLLVTWAVLSLAFPSNATAILIAAAWLAVQQFAELARSSFLAGDRMTVAATHSSVENIAWLAAIVGVLAAGGSIEAAFAAGLAVLVVSTIVGLLLLGPLLGWWLALPSRTLLAELIRRTPAFAAFTIFGQLYSRVDTLLVGALLPAGLASAGAYFAAARIIATFEYLPDAVTRAIYPDLARAYAKGSSALRSHVSRPAEILLWVSIPLPLGLLFGAAWGFPLLFGPEVGPYSWILIALGALLPVRFLGYVFGIMLTSGGRQGRRALVLGAAAMVVIGVDSVLLPVLGLPGAVIGAGTAWTVTFTVYLLQARRAFGLPPLVAPALVWAACALVAFGAASIVPHVVDAQSAVPLGCVVFCLVYLATSVGMRRPAGPSGLDAIEAGGEAAAALVPGAGEAMGGPGPR